MDNQWKAETCRTCNFVVEWWSESGFDNGICRKNPPSLKGVNIDHYPSVTKTSLACSCWRDHEDC